jgi:hypothetical protein
MSEQYDMARAMPVATVVADMLKLKRYKALGRQAQIGLASTLAEAVFEVAQS